MIYTLPSYTVVCWTTVDMSGAAVVLLAKQKGRWKEEIAELEAAFRKADVNGDGKVINE